MSLETVERSSGSTCWLFDENFGDRGFEEKSGDLGLYRPNYSSDSPDGVLLEEIKSWTLYMLEDQIAMLTVLCRTMKISE